MGNFKEKLRAAVGKDSFTSSTMTAVIIGVFIVANLVLYVLGAYFSWFFHVLDTDDFTISSATDALFDEAKAEGKTVEIIFCQPRADVQNDDTGNFVLQTAEQFEARHEGFIKLEFVNIVTGLNERGESFRERLNHYKDADGENNDIYKSSVIFVSGDNYKVVTDIYSSAGYADFYTLDNTGSAVAYNGEETVASMINWVLTDSHKKAYFTTFHGETADKSFYDMLVRAGYVVETVDLKKTEVPEDAELLVISNPLKDFERAQEGSAVRSEIERIRTYLESGGNLYVSIDPYVDKLPMLSLLIAEYGIELSYAEREGKTLANIVRDPDNAITTDYFTLVGTLADNERAGAMLDILKGYDEERVLVRESGALLLSGEAKPILVSSSSAETYASGSVTDSSGGYCLAATAPTENGGAMFVVPSVYMTATDALVSGGYANRDFLYSAFDTLFGQDRLPYGCKTVFYDSERLENLTMATARIYTVIAVAIPVAIAAVGAVVIIRRKNR